MRTARCSLYTQCMSVRALLHALVSCRAVKRSLCQNKGADFHCIVLVNCRNTFTVISRKVTCMICM